MKENLGYYIKKSKPCILIILCVICMYKTNSNPEILIQRIFRPIKVSDGGTIYYAGFIPIILMFKVLKDICINRSYNIFSSLFRILVIMVIAFNLIDGFWEYTEKIYKSCSNNLSAIYLDRNYGHPNINYEIEDNKISGTCELKFKNYSPHAQSFYVKIEVPKHDDQNYYIDSFSNKISGQCIELKGNSEKVVTIKLQGNIVGDIKVSNGYGSFSVFDISIFNNNDKKIFIDVEY